ncbi:hypothetical protein ANN_12853 [Periplaneta americana]|uniref:DUF4817 domain-containing protein n=1 Tax=Periplaneta americana TaxID=6978 RepID=A0ABQ8TKF8_PERAM|nr:hypothetical protein ANN_12853 [Periplaneta americana]
MYRLSTFIGVNVYSKQIASKSLPSKETLRGHSDSSFRGEGYIQCCVGVRLCVMYSNQELAEIHFMYGKADGNAALARRLYQERYPQRQCPDRKTFMIGQLTNVDIKVRATARISISMRPLQPRESFKYSVTAAVVGSSEQAPTFRLLSRSRNIPCATRYCEPATAGQVSSSESEHCYFGTGGSDLLFIFATVPRESEHTLCHAVLRARNSWASEQLGVGTLLFRNRRFRPTVHFCNSSETGTVPK